MNRILGWIRDGKKGASIKLRRHIYRSEGFPERDIWSLHVMGQGSSQIGRLVGTPSPSPPPPSPGSSGWHSGYRGSTQKFELDWSSIVIWPGEQFLKKCLFCKYFQNGMLILGGHWKFKMLTKNKMFKWTYLQFPPILERIHKIIELPHFYPLWGAYLYWCL